LNWAHNPILLSPHFPTLAALSTKNNLGATLSHNNKKKRRNLDRQYIGEGERKLHRDFCTTSEKRN